MRQLFVGCFVVTAYAVLGSSCHLSGTDAPDTGAVARVPPSGVSDPDGWQLFDRSVSAGYVPDSKPLEVTFDRPELLTALKVYGPAPYRLEVRGAGLPTIDLSTLSRGWHRFEACSVDRVSKVELRFEALGAPDPLPEIVSCAPSA
jgi:hypothetical protein